MDENVNGNIKFDNGTAQTVKNGDTVITGTNQQITLPGADKVANVYVIYDGEPRVATVKYVDVDNNYKVLHTDIINGKVGQTQSYSTANEISKYAHYHVQKDELTDTNAQRGITGISFDATDEPQKYTVYLKHDTKQTDTPKTVTETIDYQYENGSKVADSVTKSATLVHHVTTDLVTNQNIDDHWDDPMFLAEVPSPKIAGYTPSQSKVDQMLVNKNGKDRRVTVNYLADAQKITVSYVDEQTGKTLSTKTLNGHSDQSANYSTKEAVAGYEKQGYTLASDDTNGANLVFDHDDNADQSYTVKFNHKTITITPDNPQNPGTTIPGTNQTFPQGVAKDDLNKDITRTITVESTPHSKKQGIIQLVHLKRTATVDAVTGKVDYGNGWSTGNWTPYRVPTVPGYTPSQSTVSGKKVDYTTPNTEVTITYSPNEYTGKISYVDDQGHEQSSTALAGKTDQTIDVDTDNVPAGWVKEDGQNLPKKMTITDQGITTVYVHIKHGKVVVNPDQPKTPQDKLPDNPSQGYPAGVDYASLNKHITRTIEVLDPHTGKTTTTQTVHLTQQATVDEVTGQVTYGDWKTGEWDEFTVPAVAGYTPSEGQVASQKVTDQTNDTTVTITYTANDQQTSIIYQDKDGKTIKTDTVKGKTDKTVKTNSTVPAGWEVVTGEKPAPSEITFTGDHTPDTIVTVQHKHDIVNPGDDQPTGPLPGDKGQNYPQLEALTKNVHFTVRITDPRTGKVTTKAQEADYVRQADIDEVTGDVAYSDWKPAAAEASVDTDASQTQSFAAQADDEPADADLAVSSDGSVKVKGDDNVTATTPDRLVEVTYTANPQSGKIIYVNPNGNPIAETPIQGVTDQTIPFTPQIPAGYELVPGQSIPTEITFNGAGQPVIVKVEIEKIPTRGSHGGNGQANGGYYSGAGLQNDGSRINAAGQHQVNAQQLPQTGNENSSALAGLGLVGLTLSMFGFKKREDD